MENQTQNQENKDNIPVIQKPLSLKKEHYFLTDKTTINKVIEILDLDRNDTIIEFGAGIGSISQHLTNFKKMILIEKNKKMSSGLLKKFGSNFRVQVICGDALKVVKTIPCTKILSCLPSKLTSRLFSTLRKINFETALVFVPKDADLTKYEKWFKIKPIQMACGMCFKPYQPFDSFIYKIEKRQG